MVIGSSALIVVSNCLFTDNQRAICDSCFFWATFFLNEVGVALIALDGPSHDSAVPARVVFECFLYIVNRNPPFFFCPGSWRRHLSFHPLERYVPSAPAHGASQVGPGDSRSLNSSKSKISLAS